MANKNNKEINIFIQKFTKQLTDLLTKTCPHYVGIVSGVLLLLLMALTFVDVVGRYLFSIPVKGSSELTEITQAIFIITGVWIITMTNAHITVDLFGKYFSERFARIWQRVVWVLFIISFFYAGDRILYFAARSLRRDAITEYLQIPVAYEQYYIGAVCILISITLSICLVIHCFAPHLFKTMDMKQTDKDEPSI